MITLLMGIVEYSINGYWWLLMVIILVVIGHYSMNVLVGINWYYISGY